MAFEIRETVDHVLSHAESIPDMAFFGLMFAGSLLEYVIPPIPGDLWTAAGAILIARGQKFLTVFLGVNLGSAAGFLIDYLFGFWLARPGRGFRRWGPRWERMGLALDRIARGFERHTAMYLAVNRFLPGIRALFFVAAGFARVPIWKVLVFGLASSVAWNLILIGAGFSVGLNFERLTAWMATYTWAAWAALAAAAAIFAIRLAAKRRRKAGGGSPPEP